ncbi:Arc family DNA-binding protein [Kozakia baliensis]|uniref:Arc family DNA-binding protein n=1 Tax=Kozakia baliensis TaxID=153496 RepID=UPI0009DE1186|nr:Arc family DNA-binding protein [Kozakia baliensis]
MKQTDPHFKMRLSPELKERIAEAAKKNGRSMNAEVVHRLQNSFEERDFWLSEENRDVAFENLGDDEGMLLSLFRDLDQEDTKMFLRLLGHVLRKN